ncbi:MULTISPECIES: hypothetical protein [unclassified Romboutsia]|uniref:hypothetical protein n=1 Tax=unclassified Romboutsia TaxID=2626894 RepID=UPI0008212F9E|nr:MULTISPECIES: hypothetical protein [unclassified Romboutsia]SCI21145.1 Uncharacterised protein [uncultured Clostridium sp.]
MKKYTMINFLKEDFNLIKLSKIIICLFTILSIFLMVNIKQKDKENKEVQINQDIERNLNLDIEDSTYKEIYVKVKDIKLAYKVIGKENIKRLLIENNNVEIEGICEDLNMLEKLKTQSGAKDFSIESIVKEEEHYMFKLKYNVGV